MASKNFNMSFDPETKKAFGEIVEGYGLTVPQAFKLLANQVIKTGVLPLQFDWQAKTPVNTPNTNTDQSMTNSHTHSQYEAFNFDLERMQKAVDSGFVKVPYFETDEELISWIESGA